MIPAIFAEAGVPLDDRTADQLAVYLDLLLRWNARTNLTAIREPDQIVRRHFVESFFCAQHLPASTATLLDYGSGAGLPGIPISLTRPKTSVTLAESQGKKAAFLREAIRELDLKAEVWDRRVEAMPLGRVFEAITLRAVDKMAAACRLALPRLAPTGHMVLFATEGTESGLRAELPELRWAAPIQLPASQQGILLLGRR